MASTSASERPYLTITTNIPFRGPPPSPDSSDGADGEPIPSEDYRRLIAESEQHVLMRRSPPVGARAAVRIMFDSERESGAEWQDSTYPDSGPSASASASASDADTGSFDPMVIHTHTHTRSTAMASDDHNEHERGRSGVPWTVDFLQPPPVTASDLNSNRVPSPPSYAAHSTAGASRRTRGRGGRGVEASSLASRASTRGDRERVTGGGERAGGLTRARARARG